MHEFSTVKNIVKSVMKAAKKENATEIAKLDIKLGELTLLEEEQMKFWLKLMLSETEIGKSTRVTIRRVKGIIKCKNCGYKGTLKTSGLDHFFPIIKCPECEKFDIEIIEGNDCIIESIEVEI